MLMVRIWPPYPTFFCICNKPLPVWIKPIFKMFVTSFKHHFIDELQNYQYHSEYYFGIFPISTRADFNERVRELCTTYIHLHVIFQRNSFFLFVYRAIFRKISQNNFFTAEENNSWTELISGPTEIKKYLL